MLLFALFCGVLRVCVWCCVCAVVCCWLILAIILLVVVVVAVVWFHSLGFIPPLPNPHLALFSHTASC